MAAILEGVTLGIAITGAALGLLNTWKVFHRDRIRLRVVPDTFYSPPGEFGLRIEIINLSYLPVTVSQVGVELSDAPGRSFNFTQKFMDDTRLPHRMEPRTSFSVILLPGLDRDTYLEKGRRAVIRTACGRTFYGKRIAYY